MNTRTPLSDLPPGVDAHLEHDDPDHVDLQHANAGDLGDEHDEHDEPPLERDWEAEARAMGWKPKEQFRGNQADHVDPKTFVLRGEEQLPILRDRVRRLGERNDRKDKEIGELRRSLDKQEAAIADLVDLAKSSRKAGYDQAMKELRDQRREAIRQGDEQAVDQIDEQIREAEAAKAKVEKIGQREEAPPPKPAGEAPKFDPALPAFIQANPWFNTDAKLRALMIAEDAELIASDPDLPVAERLELAKAEVVKRYPEKFPAARRPAPAAQPAHEDEDDVPAPPPRRPAPTLTPRAAATPPAEARTRSPFERITDPEDRAEARKQYDRMRVHDQDLGVAEWVDVWLGGDPLEARAKHRKGK